MTAWLERLREALAPGITVERAIASGGMGHVALGRDTVLDRPIAIKVLKPEQASAVNAERFIREARRAAGLRHPNIVQVHRADQAGGFFYYTMDYVAGETLARRLERGPLERAALLGMARDLLAALGAAHAAHLVHRDVKPSNIFLDRGRALLGDFGIAYAADAAQAELTGTGEVVGTPAYISPEQLRGGRITPATDTYLAGLVLYEASSGRRWTPLSDPDRGDWEKVPADLREPIRRALRIEPEERWPGVDAFAAGLGVSTRRRSLAVHQGWLAALLGAGMIAALTRLWGPTEQSRDLVIFPFGTAQEDSALGARLAGLTGYSFERLTELRLAPRQVAYRRWRGSTLPPGKRLEALTRSTRSRHGAWAFATARGRMLEVRLRVVGSEGQPLLERRVVGDSADLPALGDSLALTITRALFAGRARQAPAVLAPTSLPAQIEFLLGEDAFARDAYLTAERHYIRAMELDSTFLLAAWRLGNVRRWMPLRSAPPYPPGFFELYQRRPEALPEADRYLIEAQFRPSGAPRFERYADALRVAGDDPYAALLYGDELFHRGPLAGRPLSDAIAMLQRAVAMDSTLAPAWEHLAWAWIRAGDAERAREALSRLERLAGHPEESEIYLPMFLRLAYEARFGTRDDAVRAQQALRGSPGALAIAARGAMSFDLPLVQVALGEALAASGETADLRASGFTARGVALFALGRPREALAAFDSAALRFERPAEARLQAAEWRVVPAALGVSGVDPRERAAGLATLTALAEDSLVGPRAAWALALDAAARGDTVALGDWAARIQLPPSRGERLVPLLEGVAHAARGRWEDALAASAPGLAQDSAGYAPDPFFRAALHLLRGEWLARLDRAAEADRAWLWYESLDVSRWPSAEAQAAEVDWALSTHARWRRARLAMAEGKTTVSCLMGRRVSEIWSAAEPSAVPSEQVENLTFRCPV